MPTIQVRAMQLEPHSNSFMIECSKCGVVSSTIEKEVEEIAKRHLRSHGQDDDDIEEVES